MARLIFTVPALDDIDDIVSFIGKDSEHHASILVKTIFKSVTTLKKHPRFGRVVPEAANNNIRELIEGSYRIIYKIVGEDRIDILTIHNSSRLLLKDNLE